MLQSDKKVLIITYYWPPSGGSGVQRWLKFVKYLPQFGWKPFVFTPQNPSYTIIDESLAKNVPPEATVVRIPIWEPYDAFGKLSGVIGQGGGKMHDISGKNRSWFKRVSTWIRGNVIIPDPRVFWVKPSVKFLRSFIADNQIGLVITTGPPHSIHLIGYRLKKQTPSLKWIADFRDPWSRWGLLDSLSVSDAVKRIHARLERRVLQTADVVTTITPFYVRQFQELGNRGVQLLTNGFDDEDFTGFQIVRAEKFIIRHVGIVNEKCNPRPFMEALASLMSEDAAIRAAVRIEFVGEVNNEFKSYVKANDELSRITSFIPTVPHKELPTLYGSSAMLLLILVGYKDAEGYMPGKLFEYLATGIPVLGVGPVRGDAASLLKESGGGVMASPENHRLIHDFIKDCYKSWTTNSPGKPGQGIEHYSRRGVTKKLAGLLDELMSG
jgi:glycosyltransferase involved in cell wall biosynthesis